MPRGTTSTPPPPERITDIDVSEEMRWSYLEYAYSVIYQRALPDARDGLKPVQRRILYQMAEMGLRPDRGHVKSARVVGEVMGKLHPHGDSAIYDALVRMAQAFSMRVPLVDGHGNFGSLGGDDSPAAMRYTEARLTSAAVAMVASLDEDVVDFIPNYDGQEREPDALPSAFPGLLVNGASGIAVGMATNMAPHNLGEVVAAARHLVHHPEASLDELMRFVPGPDLPTGGQIVGLDGVREAYATGRGTFRMRASAQVERVSARRKGIVVTALPYAVGPERVIARVKELVQSGRLKGIADVKDLTDREKGLRLVIEIKNAFNPDAVLAELYRLTPMEESFGINNVALVEGRPRTLGLKELLEVYVRHRLEVVRRRSEHRRTKRQDRLHLVDGLIVALLNIDEVIQVIRSSDDARAARDRLMTIFDLSERQAQYILDTPLRRLTKYDRLELERERETLRGEIAELTAILTSDERLRQMVSDELAEVAREHADPRRTVLLEDAGTPVPTVPLEVMDDPCLIVLSATGRLARTPTAEPPVSRKRAKHDVVSCVLVGTARGTLTAVTSGGRLLRVNALDLPVLPAGETSLGGGAPAAEFFRLTDGEEVLGLASLEPEGPGLAVGTARGVVKRIRPEYPQNKDAFEVIALRGDDRVVGAVQLETGDEDLVFVTNDTHLLRFPASLVRPQGLAAAGMVGMRVADGARVRWFGAVPAGGGEAVVVTVAGRAGKAASAKITPLDVYPRKGRATGGVRCHRLLKGADELVLAWAGQGPAGASTSAGTPVQLPDAEGRRDGSGTAVGGTLAAVGRTPGD
ncbi:MAG: DNA gyrase/topoisomerase IV subunit A [Streptosporangiaceae bacterium]